MVSNFHHHESPTEVDETSGRRRRLVSWSQPSCERIGTKIMPYVYMILVVCTYMHAHIYYIAGTYG